MNNLASVLTGIHGERVALSDVAVSAVLRDLLAEVTVSQTVDFHPKLSHFRG